MKRLTAVSILAISLAFTAPMQASAAWWNLTSWFAKNQQVEEQKQSQNATSSDMTSGSQIVDQSVGKVEQKDALAPLNNTKSSDAKTIEDLRAEVATLKTSLDNLEKRFNGLQKARFAATLVQPLTEKTDLSPRIITLERRVDASQGLETRIKGLEQKVAELSNISTNTNSSQAKNYDSQISEMAKRINALMHAESGLGDMRCTLGQPVITSLKELPQLCASVYADLNY